MILSNENESCEILVIHYITIEAFALLVKLHLKKFSSEMKLIF